MYPFLKEARKKARYQGREQQVEYIGFMESGNLEYSPRESMGISGDLCAVTSLECSQTGGSQKLLNKRDIYRIPNEFNHIQ